MRCECGFTDVNNADLFGLEYGHDGGYHSRRGCKTELAVLREDIAMWESQIEELSDFIEDNRRRIASKEGRVYDCIEDS